MGDRKIKSHRIPSLAAVLAPLVLAGCGMPVGVQIASLFADGLSFIATEKTLGDHGLSAVAGRDCAVWRGLNGENICRDHGTEMADTGTQEQVSASSNSIVMGNSMADVPFQEEDAYVWGSDEAWPAPTPTPKTTEVAAAPQEPSWANPGPAAVTEAPATPPPVPPMTVPPVSMQPVPMQPAPPVAMAAAKPTEITPEPAARVPAPAPAKTTETTETTLKGGTFYVIASYRGIGYARRFASRQEGLAAKVLTGTAGGLSVYRVAVGPVAKADRSNVRTHLLEAGFLDVWALDLKNPKEAVELASLL